MSGLHRIDHYLVRAHMWTLDKLTAFMYAAL